MNLDRRQALQTFGFAAGAAGLAFAARAAAEEAAEPPELGDVGSDWDAVRGAFGLEDGIIHMSAMLLASHPRPVAEAIAAHRAGLDANPVTYVERNDNRLQTEARRAAAAHLDTDVSAIALVGSTTQAVGLVYNGLRLEEGQEILTTEQDYYVTHEATRLAAARTGATVRRISLYDDLAEITPDALADRLAEAVEPQTRVMALTWVHSSTGLKLPLPAIAERLAAINTEREVEDQVLLAVDGVHGFGIEDVSLSELGCDFFMAGCHKWLFGPRGTGIIAMSERGRAASRAIIPSFIDDGVFHAWLTETEPRGTPSGAALTPGGFKAFEHLWALPDAYRFHGDVGAGRIEERTHALATQLKEGLQGRRRVALATPMEDKLSAGIVSFNVNGYSPNNGVRTLRGRQIIASAAPYATQYIRLTPSIVNTPEEVDQVLEVVAAMGG